MDRFSNFICSNEKCESIYRRALLYQVYHLALAAATVIGGTRQRLFTNGTPKSIGTILALLAVVWCGYSASR